MARGKITEYDVGSFSQSAVGVPGADKSGQIIASGAEAVGKALAAREDTSNTLSAMDKFGAFQFDFQQKKMELQQQYQNNPADYPAAVAKLSSDLSDNMGKGMSGGVFTKFKSLTTNALAQDADNNAKWALQRDNEIQVGKITSIKQNIALKASGVTSPDDLQGIFADFAATDLEATKFITPEDNKKLTDKAKELAVKYAFDAQLISRPMSFKSELEGGAYSKVLSDAGFGPDIALEYTNKARNAVINKVIDDQYRTAFLAQGKILDIYKGIDDGSLNITNLIAEREAVNANRKKVDALGQPIVPAGYIRSLDAAIDTLTQAQLRTDPGKQKREEVLKKFDLNWNSYLQTKEINRQRPGLDDLNKELDLYAELRDNYNKGLIDKNDFDTKVAIMTTKHNLSKMAVGGATPFTSSVDQAGMVPGGWFSGPKPGNDVMSLGYNMIKDHVDKAYPELGVDERRDLKAQMLSQYHQKITATPEDNIKTLKTENERKGFAQKLIYGGTDGKGGITPGVLSANSYHTDPTTQKQYRVGEPRQDRIGGQTIFLGKDANGRSLWKLSSETEGKVFPFGNRKLKAVSANQNTGSINWEDVTNGAK